MQTLSYGFQQPTSGDKGSSLFTALNSNIQQTNDHNHDGVSSAPLSAQNIQTTSAPVPQANWASYTGAPTGHYRQLVTMPAGFTFGNCSISVRTASGQYVYPTIEQNDQTSFYIYTTDNTIGFVAVYGI